MSAQGMGTSIRLGLLALVIGVAGCDDGRGGSNGDAGTASVGASCAEAADCASGICIPIGTGEGRCSASCVSTRTCPPDWTCADVGGMQACTCTATPETCNGHDDDCDAHVDEGSGPDVGCAMGETCSSASCSCPPANVCGGSCVDTASDPHHCGACGNECASGECRSGSCCDLVPGVTALDLLLMVDNSNSMGEEQSSLAAELPRLIEVLTTGDANLDGDNADPGDFPPITDIHVGVVTSDMGVATTGVPTCDATGDDGILHSCSGTGPAFLTFGAGQPPLSAMCLAGVGTGGCGFEQQLESVLKAVSPAAPTAWTAPGYAPPTFVTGAGHEEDANAGFLRPDSTLAIVMLTDEDDCSARDPGIYDVDSTTYSGPLNLRCDRYEDQALQPIERFVNGMIALRGSADDVVFMPITGIPPDLDPEPGARPDYDALVGPEAHRDPRMIPTVSDSGADLQPSCNVPGLGTAFPPVRVVSAAQGLDAAGARVAVHSICRSSYAGATDDLVGMLSAPRVSCGP